MRKRTPRTAFVLAGGGSLGAVQVGMLSELTRVGLRPDFVVGSSVGALNAGFFAGGPTADGVSRLAKIWRSLRRSDVFPVSLGSALQWLRGPNALFDPSRLRRLIERHLPYQSLQDAEIPVHVVATNLGGEQVLLSRGPAVDAILASSAIPVVFPSVKIGEEQLMDGAVSGNTPILAAAELGATRIVVLPTGFACTLEEPPRGAIGRGFHALTLLIAHQTVRDVDHLAGRVEIITAPHLCPLAVSPFDFSCAEALIARSAAKTRQWLESDGLARREVPHATSLHSHDVAAEQLDSLV
jgi:NTE family protein